MKRISGVLLAALIGGASMLTPSVSAAFCGFYVAGADAKLFSNATTVVLMRDGTTTVLSMQNDYQGPPEQFALVIPVPVVLQEGDVKILRQELFERVETLSAPRLVEYWERDPCAADIGFGNVGLIGRGGGGGTGTGYGSGAPIAPTVKIEAQFEVGEYEIVILSATESNGLDSWLRAHDYNIPAGAEPLLRPYVEEGMKFFVAKVDPQKVKFGGNGRAMLSPLRFHYDSKDFALPVRLGLINAPDPASGGKQDLLVHILAPNTRYQLANYPNATIPTNLDLEPAAKQKFGEFYVSLFDSTLAKHPGAVVTEYAWGAASCDPCPGIDAALSNAELLELGADVLPGWADKVGMVYAQALSVTYKPTVDEGKLDANIVRRIMRAHVNEHKACYSAALRKTPDLAGDVVLEFEINAKGKVASAKVSSDPASNLGDAKVEQCLVKALRRWTFPQPSDGRAVKVTAAVTLSNSGKGGLRSRTSMANEFVLTRLHARYDASGLGEDLVFEAAEPITGGREFPGGDGRLEQGAQPGTVNNFQARYAIRHAWQGAIECETPVRGNWSGGPPGGGENSPTVARKLSTVDRGLSLGSFLAADASPQPDGGPAQQAEVSTQPATVEAEKPAGGCTCSSGGEAPAGALLGLLALLGIRRRRGDVRTHRSTRSCDSSGA